MTEECIRGTVPVQLQEKEKDDDGSRVTVAAGAFLH